MKKTLVPIIALSSLARMWGQPRCSSTDEWTKKPWHIYAMEYYSAIKRNAFESVLMKQMGLEPIAQGEVSHREKTNIHTHTHGI